MNLADFKLKFLEKGYQFILLDKSGAILESCNSLVEIKDWYGDFIYEIIPFFETLRSDIESLQKGERKLYPCFQFPFKERVSVYDISIEKSDIENEELFLCVLEDSKENYEYWKQIQQERNQAQVDVEVISNQAKQISEINKEIKESISYAKKIQSSILPSQRDIEAILDNYFLLYKPKDIVSGDFYWVDQVGDDKYFCVADATGHGVPGAFMSLIGIFLFNAAIDRKDITIPAEIFNYTRQGVINALNQDSENSSLLDGLDATMCLLTKSLELTYAGAYSNIILVSSNHQSIDLQKINEEGELAKEEVKPDFQNEEKSLYLLKGDRFPLALQHSNLKSFTSYKVQLRKGDRLFLFTDGFRDQFGGKFEKKIGFKLFKQLLLETSTLDLISQKVNLNIAFESWRGRNMQIDDVCVLGVEI